MKAVRVTVSVPRRFRRMLDLRVVLATDEPVSAAAE